MIGEYTSESFAVCEQAMSDSDQTDMKALKLKMQCTETGIGKIGASPDEGGNSVDWSDGLHSTQSDISTGRSKQQQTNVNKRDTSSTGQGPSYQSWYQENFHDDRCEVLGKGAFGVVKKVKHKLDAKEYAVKRIRLRARSKDDKEIKEAKALARLDHKNIVRYHCSWLERPPLRWQETLDVEQGISNSSSSGSSDSNPFLVQHVQDKSDSDIQFVDDAEIQWGPAKRQERNSDFDLKELNKEVSLLSSYDKRSEPNTEASEISANVSSENQKGTSSIKDCKTKCEKINQAPVYLYIQMELCKKETLKDWLQNNCEKRCTKFCQEIFKDLASGLDYIHKQKMIHRDLKPSNIYFSLDSIVKIGDFGLVTSEDDSFVESNSPSDCKDIQKKHTEFVGTEMYMSEEQKSSKTYNQKVDIYALGLICFELTFPMGTGSEKQRYWMDARKCGFPSEISKEMCEFLAKLLSPDPEERPNAECILEDPYIHSQQFMLTER